MNRTQLQKLLENALNSIPSIVGNTSMTGYDEDEGYVSCNRRGRGGSPKIVYKLEKHGDGVRLSLLVRNTPGRVQILTDLYEQKQVGLETYEILEDFGVRTGKISSSDVNAMVKAFYDAYDAKLMHR